MPLSRMVNMGFSWVVLLLVLLYDFNLRCFYDSIAQDCRAHPTINRPTQQLLHCQSNTESQKYRCTVTRNLITTHNHGQPQLSAPLSEVTLARRCIDLTGDA